MSVTVAFAGIAVADFSAMVEWYERLLGRPADMLPHETEAAWQLTEGGWLYVVEDPDRVGRGLLTLMVDDLDEELTQLAERGIDAGEIITMPGKARKADIDDPEGNRVSFGQPLSS